MDNIEQKVKELMEKFMPHVNWFAGDPIVQIDNAKQCALICVDEIIETLDEISLAESGTIMMDYGQSEFKKIKEKIQSL